MRNILFLCSLVLLMSQTAYAHAYGRDTDSTRTKNIGKSMIETQILRAFPDLDKYVQENARTSPTLNVPYGTTAEFTPEYIAANYPIADVVADNRTQAANTFAEIERKGNFTDYLTPNDLVELPIGMKKRMGNTLVTIGVSRAKFMSQYSELTVFCKIEIPQGNKVLFFGLDGVKLSNGGGLIGDANLVLLGDFQVPVNGNNSMLILKGGFDMRTGDVSNLTYAKLQCGGVKEIGIQAEIALPRGLVKPVDSNYKVIEGDSLVKGKFRTVVEDWNNILASVTLPKFALNGLDKLCFEVTGASFDFSDFKNPMNMAFPVGYGNVTTGNLNLWRGIYINDIKVYLPKEFKRKNKTERTYFQGKNILIDNWGFTGLVSANGEVFQDGTASGWDFSLEKIEVNIQANVLRGASFEGAIALPVSKKKIQDTKVKQYGLGYRGIFTADNGYMMAVELKKALAFDLWKASVNIDSGSYIQLNARDDVFRPVAYLHGSMGIKVVSTSDTTRKDVEFNGITFKGLKLETESPYISVSEFGYKSTSSVVSSFPLTISNLSFKKEANDDLAIGAKFKLNLMEKGNFAADASLRVIGKITSSGNGISYEYKETLLDSANIFGDFGGFTVKGGVKFMRGHPKMGNGFSGNLSMKLKMKEGNDKGIDIAGAFGTKPSIRTDTPSTFRYWYVDALVSGLDIPVAPGLNIVGLGGGASFGMKKTADAMITHDSLTQQIISFTGTAYEPDEDRGLSLRAMVSLGIQGDAGNGDACLEMTFNKPADGGGLARIGLFGRAQIMPPQALTDALKNETVANATGRLKTGLTNFTSGLTDEAGFNALVQAGNFNKIAETKNSVVAPVNTTTNSIITAKLGIEYDFATKTLTGNIDADMTVANNILTGTGKIRLKFAPNRWYIYVGEPDPSKRFTVQLNASGIKDKNNVTGGISLSAYFVIGDSIPGSPPPPAEVANILGVKANALDYMRDVNALGNGKGFAFGASFAASTGDLNGGIFYANFRAGAGFDVMIKKYPENTTYNCYAPNGTPTASGTTFGLNGWYANGQAYAYLQGELGIRVAVWGVEKKIAIIKGEAAVLLQAKLPNPSWFSGHMAGSYSVLGGVVSGNFTMKITLGQENCRFNSAPPEREKFITAISPDSASTGVDVMANITTTFRYPLNNHFTVSREDFNDPDAVDVYSAMRYAFEVKNVATNQLVAGTIMDTGGDDLVFQPNDFLAANTTYSVRVVIRIDKKRGEGWWLIDAIEEKISTFTTGEAPQGIPLSNIEYSYPAAGQKYFHPGESNIGFIKLKRGMSQLSDLEPSQSLIVALVHTNAENSYSSPLFSTATYDPTSRIISFPINTEAGYYFHWAEYYTLYLSKTTIGWVDPSYHRSNDELLLSFKFNLSKYPTFAAKMAAKFNNATRSTTNLPLVGGDNVPVLNASSNIVDEPFDETELYGTKGTSNKPLIRAENSAFQIVYHWEGGPVYWYSALDPKFALYDPLISSWLRNEGIETHNNKKAGWPLVRTLEVSPIYKNAMRNPENAESIAASGGVASTVLQKMMPFSYMAAKYYQEDFDFCKDYLHYKYLCPIVIGSGGVQGGGGNSSGGGANFSGDGDGDGYGNANVPNPTNCTALAVPSYLNTLNNTPTCPPMPAGNYPVAFKYTLPNGVVTSTYNFNFVKQ